VFNGQDKLIVRVHHDIGTLGRASAVFLSIEIHQDLFVRPFKPGLKVTARVASAVATCAEA